MLLRAESGKNTGPVTDPVDTADPPLHLHYNGIENKYIVDEGKNFI